MNQQVPRMWCRTLWRQLGSIGFGLVILLAFFVLTLLGTLMQVQLGLYAAQQKYFYAWGVVHWIYNTVPLPLPGGRLLMWLLFANLAAATITTYRHKRRHGILLSHLGILLLLVSVFVSFRHSIDGSLVLYEGQSSDRYVSAERWVIELTPLGVAQPETLIIDDRELLDLADSDRSFHHPNLPFELRIDSYQRNSHPVPAASVSHGVRLADGYALQRLHDDPAIERNIPGCFATIRSGDDETEPVILWGNAAKPWVVQREGADWQVDLTRRSWPLPCEVRLDAFTRELYPGTQIPKVFRSNVTVLDDGAVEQASISMNAPLRRGGYAMFQSSWGPPDPAAGRGTFSVISVVRNPADHWPMYASVVVALGMLLHFGQRLVRHLARTEKAA